MREPWNSRAGIYRIAVLYTMVIVVLMCIFPIEAHDLFFYLQMGRYFAAHYTFPSKEIYLFTLAGKDIHVLHEWGTFVFYSAVYKLGGFTAIIMAKTLLVTAILTLPFLLAKKLRQRSMLLPLFTAIAAYFCSNRFTERGSLFSDVFTALVVMLIILIRKGGNHNRRLIVLIPLIFLVWVNMHGGFIVGFAILGVWLIADLVTYLKATQRSRELLIVPTAVLSSSLLVSMINPMGWRVFAYPLRPILMDTFAIFKASIMEWMSPFSEAFKNTNATYLILILFALSYLFVLLCAIKDDKTKSAGFPYFELFLLILLTYLGLTMVRFVTTIGFSLPLIWASLGSRLQSPEEREDGEPARPDTAEIGCLVTLMAAIIAIMSFWGYKDSFGNPRRMALGLNQAVFPSAAVEFIDANNLDVNIFNEYSFGCYLIWRWNGKRQIFYHGFVDDPVFFADMQLGVFTQPGAFDKVVQKYDIGAMVLLTIATSRHFGPDLYRMLLTHPDWHLVFADRVSLVFVKDVPKNKEIIERYSVRNAIEQGPQSN